jgi:hypothetical protein
MFAASLARKQAMRLHHDTVRDTPLHPLLLRQQPGGDVPASPDGATAPEHEAAALRPVLVCRACRTVITGPEHAMEVDGAHRHVFFNPHGLVFEVGCFASARNVVPTGPKTDEFTWFAGHAWQAVLCAGCAGLLGWRYTSEGGGFFGLILPALAEDTARAG